MDNKLKLDELNEYLTEQGGNKELVAQHMGSTTRTLNRWLNGDVNVPDYVIKIIEVKRDYEEVRRANAELQAQIASYEKNIDNYFDAMAALKALKSKKVVF